jgi:hypothetical protein
MPKKPWPRAAAEARFNDDILLLTGMALFTAEIRISEYSRQDDQGNYRRRGWRGPLAKKERGRMKERGALFRVA